MKAQATRLRWGPPARLGGALKSRGYAEHARETKKGLSAPQRPQQGIGGAGA